MWFRPDHIQLNRSRRDRVDGSPSWRLECWFWRCLSRSALFQYSSCCDFSSRLIRSSNLREGAQRRKSNVPRLIGFHPQQELTVPGLRSPWFTHTQGWPFVKPPTTTAQSLTTPENLSSGERKDCVSAETLSPERLAMLLHRYCDALAPDFSSRRRFRRRTKPDDSRRQSLHSWTSKCTFAYRLRKCPELLTSQEGTKTRSAAAEAGSDQRL